MKLDSFEEVSHEEIMEDNAAIKRALAMVIQQKTLDRNSQKESVRRKIEQAELDAIAADFEEEQRKERLAQMGGGSWA